MNQPSKVEARIKGFFSDKLNIGIASNDTDLLAGGFLDSLSFVDLLLYLEEEFHVSISLDELDLTSFKSVSAIAGFITARLAYAP
jgi:acyl carrier protein